ncbi:hypothetical protein LX15_000292 [Streptoalloteichus tenebrarius]|uniref:Uncharacterized protein n=1 Tax=Streptoalloteichus tenebrarius (strain ATCC 17920 / DSM 40477 / JCM 4838 / CBS 697.72 / NBRC 16177 / NCIMB 11028 / NRRL B-12390 / A12253. 1 / ISP 5477) TaxID=1933 RepID=A0ABT1HM68_STRSD|nr:hypothetical protein [Streptoalloteichus tenebrarius]
MTEGDTPAVNAVNTVPTRTRLDLVPSARQTREMAVARSSSHAGTTR